ncbi:blastula protease 10-like [Oppia nitens]|uniref:blastula protease 10-like n=1 Tax=Oppia nitens TaxID=1686743 RepID=UPI0023DADFFD|nr:blastula protease 10-like [Oppia nitens]
MTIEVSGPTPPTVCDVCHQNLRGQIKSANYPNQYSDYMRCSYRIQAMGSQYCWVRLFLRDIDIEASGSGDCRKDALIIDNQKLCGKDVQTKEMTLTFPASEPREVHIDFQSDVSGSGRGFLIEYLQESCDTLPSNRSPTLEPPPNIIIGGRGGRPPVPPPKSGQQTIITKPDNRIGATGTLVPPVYPPNYVSRAHIEEIVQTQVQVVDRGLLNTNNQRKTG